jgi:SH3-like domain-containing protein
MLSGRRTVLVAPWSKQPQQTFTLLTAPSTTSSTIARLQPGVLGDVLACEMQWCNLSAGGVKGWRRTICGSIGEKEEAGALKKVFNARPPGLKLLTVQPKSCRFNRVR